MQKFAFRFLASSCLCLSLLIASPLSPQLAATELTLPAQPSPFSEEITAAAALPAESSAWESAASSQAPESAVSSEAASVPAEEAQSAAVSESSALPEENSSAPEESAAPAETSPAEGESVSSAPEESAPEESAAESSEPAPAESEAPEPEAAPAPAPAESASEAPSEKPAASSQPAVVQQTGSVSGGDLYYSGVRRMLDTIPLQPMASTGNADLDAKLDSIFAQAVSDNMDTHDKLRACYDYLINNTYYQTSNWAVLSPNDLYSSSYNYAYHLLKVGYGVCDSYSAAFAAMAHRIGLPMYTVRGNTSASGGGYISDHVWCQIDFNGTSYIFDPQVEDNITRSKGYIMYIRFGGTTSQLSESYWGGSELCDFAQTCKDRHFD